MSNKVWVRWKDSTTGEVLTGKVVELQDDADIDDLLQAFAKQQNLLHFSPAAIQVRETENGEKLKASAVLTDCFVPSATAAAASGPGRSEDTALFITLPQQQQQHHRDDDNILGQGVYEKLTGAVCFFSDEGNRPIGAGFAISETTVYSVAHNFPEAAVDMEISCHFGKPNQHLVRQLRISGFDRRLDYCTLKTVSGEAPLPNFLEISRVPLQPGKNCILAAFQIGIQQDMKDLDPDLSVGVFKGVISKLYPRHFVYQCPSFAGDSGGAVVLRDGKVVGIHQETVIQARERIQHGEDLDADACLESVEASIDELLRSLSSGSIGLQLLAIPKHE